MSFATMSSSKLFSAEDTTKGVDEALAIITHPKVYLGFMALAALLRTPETLSVLWNADSVNKILCLIAFAAAMYAFHTTFKSVETVKKERLLDPIIKGKKHAKRSKKRSRRGR